MVPATAAFVYNDGGAEESVSTAPRRQEEDHSVYQHCRKFDNGI